MKNDDRLEEDRVARGPLRSGAVARLAGVSTDTLRHYERMGVLPAPRRAANGYREYAPQAVTRVQLVRRALGVGFTLIELARVLRQRDQGRSPCRTVRDLAAAKLVRMERDLADLAARCDALRRTLRSWEHRLAHTPRGHQARLLDRIVVPVSDRASEPRRRRAFLRDGANASRRVRSATMRRGL